MGHLIVMLVLPGVFAAWCHHATNVRNRASTPALLRHCFMAEPHDVGRAGAQKLSQQQQKWSVSRVPKGNVHQGGQLPLLALPQGLLFACL